jgi:hypothetical protein
MYKQKRSHVHITLQLKIILNIKIHTLVLHSIQSKTPTKYVVYIIQLKS